MGVGRDTCKECSRSLSKLLSSATSVARASMAARVPQITCMALEMTARAMVLAAARSTSRTLTCTPANLGSLSCPGPLWRVHPELPRYKLEHMSTVHMSTNFARSGGKNISHDYLVRQQAMSDQHKTADCRLSTKYKTFSDPMLERILVRNPLSLDKCQVQVKKKK